MIDTATTEASEATLASWTKVGILAGFLACLAYPLMVYVPLPRVAQVALGASFGPALAAASVALAHVLAARRRTPTVELAAMANALAGALVTAMILVQLAINHSTAAVNDEALAKVLRRRIWDVVLGLDVAFDAFIGLATLLFAVNMLRDPRFGRIVGSAGVAISAGMLFGANFYYFPDPPRVHGFPEIGLFVGSWYLSVVMLLLRSRRHVGRGDHARLGASAPGK